MPVQATYSFDVFSRNDKSVNLGSVTLTIHKPITAEERQDKQTKVVMQEVFDIINGGLDEKYRT